MTGKKFQTKTLVQAAMIAAIYASLTLFLRPISFGILQFRVAEALTVLPVFFPGAVPGLFIGCLLSNILGGYGWIDIVLGSLATLAAAILTWKLKKWIWIAPFPPILVNTLVVGSYIWLLFDKTYPYFLSLLWFGLGEAGACILIGYPLLWFMKTNPVMQKLIHTN